MSEETQKAAAIMAVENATGVEFSEDGSMVDSREIKIIRANYNVPMVLIQYIIKNNPRMIRYGGSLFRFNGKHFEFLEEAMVDRLVLNFATKYGAPKIWNYVTSIKRALMATDDIDDIEKLNPSPELINASNCVVNVVTRETFPHDPKFLFDHVLDVAYDPDQTECPNFMKFLNTSLSEEQDTIENAIRIGGYMLYADNKANKFFYFNGPASAGKTTLTDIYCMFFPMRTTKSLVSNISLEKLAKQGFEIEALIYSRLIVCSETKKGYYDAEFLKQLITSDIITINRKFEKPYTFRWTGKMIISGNGMARFNDTSDAVQRRLMILEFKRMFKPQHEVDAISNAAARGVFPQDPTLKDKIIMELPAIFNLFIDGLAKLIKNNFLFIPSKSSQKAMIEFRRDSDTIREYLEDNYVVDYSYQVPLTVIFNNLRTWYMINVQDGKSLRMRSSELSKRIREVFNIEPNGRTKCINRQTNNEEISTTFPLGPREIPLTATEQDEEVQRIFNEIQKEKDKQSPLDFGKVDFDALTK